VLKGAAERMIPCYLELGGKDPMIVCADANLDRAVNAATYYSMNNGGQVCISVERVYVEEPVYDEFVSKVTDQVRKLRQGQPGGAGSVDVGAVTFPPQIEIVDDHVQDAVQKGARVLVGGHRREGDGRFFEPTVLVDVDHSMKIMTEETFGPTLPIMKVGDAEEALRLANDTVYGLQASVWTKDVERGEALARRVQAGSVCVNDAQVNYTALNLPMGGWKTSGLGTRHGAGGIRKYTKTQSLLITKMAPKRDLHMFPYSRRRTGMLQRLLAFLYGRGKRD
jgi:acyl-CoA reductase-like NAD-dependent aldehyde dehydrogenase